jgi:chaperonin GroEL
VAEGIVPGGGIALLRARRVLRAMKGTSLDHDSGLRIVERALEEPLRCIVTNAGEEASVVLQRVEAHNEPNHGFNAATREYGDLLAMGVIDPAKVTRLALLNAGSIAALVLTTACLVARAAVQEAPAGNLPPVPEPEF